MSWGINIPNVYLPRHSIAGLPTDLEMATNYYESLKLRLFGYMVATPRQIVDRNGDIEQWEDYVRFEFNDIMEELESQIIEIKLINEALNSEGLTEG